MRKVTDMITHFFIQECYKEVKGDLPGGAAGKGGRSQAQQPSSTAGMHIVERET